MALEKLRKRAYNLLRASERFTKTDMVYLAKGGFWLTFGNIISAGLSFIMAIVFANRVPADIYGTYKFILSILGLLSITTLSGIGGMLSQAVSRGLEGSFFEAWRTRMTWGCFGAVASIGVAVYYYLQGNISLFAAFLIAMVFIPIMDPLTVYQDYLQGKKLFDKYSIYASISQTFATIFMIITVFITHNLYAIFLTYLCSWTVLRGFFFLRSIRLYPPNDKVDPNTISYGKHTSFIDIIATLIGSLDQILIYHYLGAVELALYNFAIAPVIQMVSVFRNIPTLAMPKMANRPIPEINKMLRKRLLVIFLISAAVVGIYAIFAPLLYQIFFPKYLGSINLSRLYALTMLLSIPLTVWSPAVNAKVNYIPKKLLYVWNIPGFLSTVTIFLLIQHVGTASVVYARIVLLLATTTITAILWMYIQKKDREMTAATRAAEAAKTHEELILPDSNPESLPRNEP